MTSTLLLKSTDMHMMKSNNKLINKMSTQKTSKFCPMYTYYKYLNDKQDDLLCIFVHLH